MIELLFLLFPISEPTYFTTINFQEIWIQKYQILSFNLESDQLIIQGQQLPVIYSGYRTVIDFQVGYFTVH